MGEQVKEGNLTKDDLDPNDAFLVSAGALGIWVWLGRKATKEERQSAMQLGEKFIRENGLPPQTALTRTFQNGEPVCDAAGGEVHPREWASTSDRPHQDFPEWGAGRVQEPFCQRVVDQSLYSNFYLSL